MVVGPDGQLPLPWLQGPLQQAQAQRSHALLLQAGHGTGALEFLLTLAQGWLCESDTGPRPCGRCASCHLVQSRTHPDLRVLLPEALRAGLGWDGQGEEEGSADGGKQRRKPSRQIRIDEVRGAIDWLANSSARGRAKVVVLHPADAMNAQAASALLKTLEEPPGAARLLLSTVDEAHLLPTVRSRCQRMRLPPPAAEMAVAWLEGQSVRDAAVLLAAAGGGPLAALALAHDGIDAAAWTALPKALVQGQPGVLTGWPVPRALDAMQKLCHDALRHVLGAVPRFFPAAALPVGGRLPALTAWSRSLNRVARHDEHPWNDGLLIEALAAEGRACWQDATPRAPRAARAFDTLGR